MNLARLVSSAVALLATGAVIGACSGATEREATQDTSQGVSCESAGIHVEDCPIPKPIPLPPKPPACPSDPGCYVEPPTTPLPLGYSIPYIQVPDAGTLGDWVQDTAFPGLLTSMGCTPEQLYRVGGTFDLPWAIAFCPTAAVDENAASLFPPAMEIPCDSCTGAPPEGYTLITWNPDIPTMQPGGGCHSWTCSPNN